VKRRIVVDASVVVKWLIPEDQSLRAVSLRERFDFAAPDLIHAEIVNILWKRRDEARYPMPTRWMV